MAINEEDYAGYAIDPKTGRRHEINHLPEQDCWEEGIYQFEQGDLLIGGPNGIDNLALNQLTNRTLYLKNRLEETAGYVPTTYDFTIPVGGWQKKETGAYTCSLRIVNENIRENAPVQIIIHPECSETAGLCGLSPAIGIGDGTITLYAKAKPQSAISASLTVFISKGGGGGGADMPIATESTLGVVKIGNGLIVQPDGMLSIDPDKVMSDVDLVDEEEVKRDVEEILNGDDET